MSVVRGTALSGYPRLVAELGGDPAELLRGAGLRPADVGEYETFLPYRSLIVAVETAAAGTATPDFGRRLALRQGIEILGPVGVAARTAATVGDAFTIVETFLAAYSPAISARILPGAHSDESFYAFEILIERPPPHPHTTELSLGVSLGVMRFLLGAQYAPVTVHLPHQPLTPTADYLSYFGCRPCFAAPTAGFTFRTADLARPLNQDALAHQAVVQYLTGITTQQRGMTPSVRAMVRQLLPTGTASLELVAAQFDLHPRTLHRRLAAEHTTFGALIDDVRRETAEHYLRDTDISLSHLTRELGYAEQSVLSRSCRRWFGCGPRGYRDRVQSTHVELGRDL
ncbi:AraC family transcriptional regulator [Mycobacterium conspicuum]|uniref:AraC family transcriptional regulator n=1 Tax=Mycobacterium conspicuum TaxID=44010 RepID=A0A1X1STI5_9MYCO|nr:AraC family transcriptional regulator [Mycobacterium conspicuum]ORV34039.1 AraC family transcriptional regulator [Mycobacterium conspicuum]BBZ38466.1 AraC family transcriptional regulator [Mycobacterium conspicuum]